MTQGSFGTTVRAFNSRRPFSPFAIELAGGRRLEIDHAMALAHRGGAAVFLAPGNVPVIFDHESVNVIVDASA